MSMGRSPLETAQVTATPSPEFAGSSPITNGTICGATIQGNQDKRMNRN